MLKQEGQNRSLVRPLGLHLVHQDTVHQDPVVTQADLVQPVRATRLGSTWFKLQALRKQNRRDGATNQLPRSDVHTAGGGTGGPPENKIDFSEAEGPETPLGRARAYLRETCNAQGITPDSATGTIISQWVITDAYDAFREKIFDEQKIKPNDKLVEEVDKAYAHELEILMTLARDHSEHYDGATITYFDFLDRYITAVSETDTTLGAHDQRMEANGYIGRHFHELPRKERKSSVLVTTTREPFRDQEEFASAREEMQELFLVTRSNSLKLTFLQAYAQQQRDRAVVQEQVVKGNPDGVHQVYPSIDALYTFESKSNLSDISKATVRLLYNEGLLKMYKDILSASHFVLEEDTIGQVELTAWAARRVYQDINELIRHDDRSPYRELLDATDPFAYARSKLIGDFAQNEWFEFSDPFLSEILLYTRNLQGSNIPYYKALLAHKRGRILEEKVNQKKKQARENGNQVHSDFFKYHRPVWLNDRGMHPFDYFSALWIADEVYETYIDASFSAQGDAAPTRYHEAYVKKQAHRQFKKDTRPLIIGQDVQLLANGSFGEVYRRHK